MSNWSTGYVEEISYTSGFYRELCPEFIRFSVLLSGYMPTRTDAFDFCELGYGQGVTCNLLAATHPDSKFYGTDFIAEHCATAVQVSKSAQLTNTDWVDKSFEAYLKTDTPRCDYIVLHGVYSWVSDAVKAQIQMLVEQKLKPGGTLYISYNAMPGWAQAGPLQELLLVLSNRMRAPSEGITSRMTRSLEFVGKLADAGALYFSLNGDLRERLQSLKSHDSRYLVHEYLNEQWRPLYFRQIAEEFAELQLRFAAHANPAEHYESFCMKAEAVSLIEGVQDTILRQTLRDYLMNTSFRKDYFMKGARRLTPAEQRKQLLDTSFALCVPVSQITNEFSAPIGGISLNAEIVSGLVETLAGGPKTLREVNKYPGLKQHSFAALIQIVTGLVSKGSLHPVPSETRDPVPSKRLNIELARQSVEGREWKYLASPLIGSAVGVNRTQMMLISAKEETNGTEEDIATRFEKMLEAQAQRLSKNNQPITDSVDHHAEAVKTYRDFANTSLPVLVAHGAV